MLVKKIQFVLCSLALVMSCSSGAPPADTDTSIAAPPATSEAGVPDSEIGLASGTAFEQPTQEPIAFNAVDPGESELRSRPNQEFPPAIPHSIADLETITLAENSCLDCHDPEAASDMGAVAIPASHLTDLRRSPDTAGESTVGARWVCTSCHVAQTDSEPLVANR